MKRFQIIVEYDGTKFVGWQRQKNGLSIQQVIEEAIEKISHQKVTLQCAGRTDSGVHALGQVAHFDLDGSWFPDKIRDGVNHFTSSRRISILKADQVSNDFNARFDALQRSYLYRILNRRSPVALEKDRVWWIPSILDYEAMGKAGKILLGKHDFSTFRAAGCQSKSSIKTLDNLIVSKIGDEIRVFAEARSFLYRQIRNIVGALCLVGEGKWSIEDFEYAFNAKDRKQGGATAPASGLYFVKVKY